MCLCVCVWVNLLSKWAKWAGSRLVQIRQCMGLTGTTKGWNLVHLQKQPNPTGVLLQVKFLFPSQILSLRFCSKMHLLLTTLGRDQTKMVFLGCVCVGWGINLLVAQTERLSCYRYDLYSTLGTSLIHATNNKSKSEFKMTMIDVIEMYFHSTQLTFVQASGWHLPGITFSI